MHIDYEGSYIFLNYWISFFFFYHFYNFVSALYNYFKYIDFFQIIKCLDIVEENNLKIIVSSIYIKLQYNRFNDYYVQKLHRNDFYEITVFKNNLIIFSTKKVTKHFAQQTERIISHPNGTSCVPLNWHFINLTHRESYMVQM